MPFSLFGKGCEIALYPRQGTRKNFDPIPKAKIFGTCKIAVSDQLFNSDANLATVMFATVAEKGVTSHLPMTPMRRFWEWRDSLRSNFNITHPSRNLQCAAVRIVFFPMITPPQMCSQSPFGGLNPMETIQGYWPITVSLKPVATCEVTAGWWLGPRPRPQRSSLPRTTSEKRGEWCIFERVMTGTKQRPICSLRMLPNLTCYYLLELWVHAHHKVELVCQKYDFESKVISEAIYVKGKETSKQHHSHTFLESPVINLLI